jgi:hypothetical protein
VSGDRKSKQPFSYFIKLLWAGHDNFHIAPSPRQLVSVPDKLQ